MKNTYNVLIFGASYGSLLATKLLLAGHNARMVCTAAEDEAAVDALHQKPFFAAPLFEIVDVIPGVEDDEDELLPFQAFEA